MDYVKRINELREERGWTVYKLSKKAGIPQQTINSFPNNSDITLGTIEKLCDAFELPLPEFFQSSNSIKQNITKKQKELLILWSSLFEQEQATLLQLIDYIRKDDTQK